MTTDEDSRPKILIVGGGIAGLEAALALADLAGDRARLAMLASEPDFFYKPLTVEEPFTHQPAERRELAPALDELGVELIHGTLKSVSPDEHVVTTGAETSSRTTSSSSASVDGRARPITALKPSGATGPTFPSTT